MKQRTKSTCPVCHCLDVFGDKWTLLIVRDILVYGKRHYKDFLDSSEGIATNILASRLSGMVEHGFLTREEDQENRSQAIYLPTEKTLALRPVLDAMRQWASEYPRA